jgi:hypothetical protein
MEIVIIIIINGNIVEINGGYKNSAVQPLALDLSKSNQMKNFISS